MQVGPVDDSQFADTVGGEACDPASVGSSLASGEGFGLFVGDRCELRSEPQRFKCPEPIGEYRQPRSTGAHLGGFFEHGDLCASPLQAHGG